MKRHGFTLVELMVVMAIMTVLSLMVAVAVTGAQESAKVSHTRAVIVRLHTLLMDRYESYRSRRVPVQIAKGSTPTQAAQLRCNAIRELMRLEMPDRFTDIIDPPVTTYTDPATGKTLTMPQTAANTAYQAALAKAGLNPNTTYQGADCLYMIVTMGLEENDVLENFNQGDIGADPNNPSLPCFVDSWGQPIQFLRWAPGFTSALQPAIPTDRDQTDPTGVWGNPPTTFALYPLIYSAGPDGFYDLLADNGGFHYSTQTIPNNPFASGGSGTGFGSVTNASGQNGSVDNVHNQAIGAH